jgi:hypothetical protein
MMRRIALLTVLGTLLAGAPAALAQTPEYFDFPSGYRVGGGVSADTAGNIWFGATTPKTMSQPQDPASLARLVPGQATPGTSSGISFYPTPDPMNPSCCATSIRDVGFGAGDGRVYYTRSDGTIGYAVPGDVTPGTTNGFIFAHLAGNQDLGDVGARPQAGVWFTESSSSNVAPYPGDRLATWNGGTPLEGPNIALQNGQTELDAQRYDAQPTGLAVAGDTPWFVESNPGLPGYRIATSTSFPAASYDEYLLTPCVAGPVCSGSYTGTGPVDVAVASDGGVWFTNELKRTFGRFDPGSHQVVQYTLASIDPTLSQGIPRKLTTAPDGTIWMTVFQGFTGATGNAIVRIVPSASAPTATVYKVASDTPPVSIAADRAGNVWFGLANVGATGRVGRLAGVVGTTGGGGGSTGGGGGGTSTTAVTTATSASTPVTPTTTTPTPVAVALRPVTTATTALTPPHVDDGAIDINQQCAGPPADRCSVIYLVREQEYVTGFPGAGVRAAKAVRKAKPRVLARRTVTLKGGQKKKVRVVLGALGKRILAKKGKLVVVFTATQQLAGGKTKVLMKKTLTFRVRRKATPARHGA